MPTHRWNVVIALCVALAGCAGAPPQRADADPPKVALAAPIVDGFYRGTSTRFRANRRDCPHPGLVFLTVQGGQFEFRWNQLLDVPASIAPDGTIQGVGTDVTLTGRLADGTLSGDVTNGTCGLHFTTRRQA